MKSQNIILCIITVSIILSVIVLKFCSKNNNTSFIVKKNKLKQCEEKPNQHLINKALKYASKKNNIKNNCKKQEFIYQLLDDNKRRIITFYTKKALKKLNKRCQKFQENTLGFNFELIDFIKATSCMENDGTTHWKTDIMVQERTLHLSLRLILDFTIYVKDADKKKVLTCAEYTTFPFPKYHIGYPTLDQMIPLPTQIVSTGPGLVLSNKGIDTVMPRFKSIRFNSAKMENSDLALGTDLPNKLNVKPGFDNNKLEFSLYSNNITKTPLQCYANKIESTGKAIKTDIIDNDTWKPPNFNCTGKPENHYHYTSNSESYKQSLNKPSRKSILRNKWPRLFSEPRDRFEFPSVPVGYKWNNIGVRYPVIQTDQYHPGKRWSTTQTPRTPLYWPTTTGIPVNDEYKRFARGFEANQPHGGFK